MSEVEHHMASLKQLYKDLGALIVFVCSLVGMTCVLPAGQQQQKIQTFKVRLTRLCHTVWYPRPDANGEAKLEAQHLSHLSRLSFKLCCNCKVSRAKVFMTGKNSSAVLTPELMVWTRANPGGRSRLASSLFLRGAPRKKGRTPCSSRVAKLHEAQLTMQSRVG